MLYSTQKISILGAGISGLGAALLAKHKGFNVFVSDSGNIKPSYKKILQLHHIPFEEGGHTIHQLQQSQKIIKSPGIPFTAPIITALNQYHLPIIDEIEFAAQYTKAKLIAITGTNGKTTAVHLLYHILKKANFRVALVGNVGYSFSQTVINDHQYDYYIIELSSFQLEGLVNFRPHIAGLLNITPDHMDRYSGCMHSYAQIKIKIIQNMTVQDHFLFTKNDLYIHNTIKSLSILPKKHSIISNNTTEIPVAIAKILQINKNIIQSIVKKFKKLPHRMEWVATIKGVQIYNDAKATNVAAAYHALSSFQQPIIWIAGGIDKGNDYKSLQKLAPSKVKALICLGKDNEKLIKQFKNLINPIHSTQCIRESAELALALSQENDIILLSPACASMDLFLSYKDKGNQFKKCFI